MNWRKFNRNYEAKIPSNTINLFNQKFLIEDVLCKMSVVEYSY
jgi:hypothetical protein